MEFLRLLDGDVVALALFREHVEDDGVVAGLGELQGADQQRQIVAVDRAEVTEAQFLENQAAAKPPRPSASNSLGGLLERHFRHGALQRLLGLVPELQGEVRPWGCAASNARNPGPAGCNAGW